jgi:NADH dehydrogenase
MSAKQIVVLGGGFAGLWAAAGAARKLDELKIGAEQVQVSLVDRDAFHSIRVRNYEADLSDTRIPLDDILKPIGVRRVEAAVTAIDPLGKSVSLASGSERGEFAYDRLVFALGSQVLRPNLTGLAEHAFDVDTYSAAARLNAHLSSLATQPDSPGRLTVVVVGAGLTGIEAAAEMPGKLRAALSATGTNRPCRVILMDHRSHVGSDMGESARPVIEEALAELGIETRLGVQVSAISNHDLQLVSGEVIPTATVVWCAGMRANPLTASFPVERDRFGRVAVDSYLRVTGCPDVFAAGDVASLRLDDHHATVMSCQFGRPMGRFAGHNAVADLLGQPMLPLAIDWYVTVLDLGPSGAIYTEGWDRHVVARGEAAKRTKRTINCVRIVPPRSGNRADILAAAAPIVERPPAYRG